MINVEKEYAYVPASSILKHTISRLIGFEQNQTALELWYPEALNIENGYVISGTCVE